MNWRDVLTDEVRKSFQCSGGYVPASHCDISSCAEVAYAGILAANEADALFMENERLKEELIKAKRQRTCEWGWKPGCPMIRLSCSGKEYSNGFLPNFCPTCGGKLTMK